jgi:erythromycin esterase
MTVWVRTNATQLRSLSRPELVAALAPIRESLKHITVMGVGAAVDGTREAFEFRHRLLQYLVTEMGFTTLAVDASYFLTRVLDHYVLTGQGDVSAALAELGPDWNTHEFMKVLDSLRSYNRSIGRKKVGVVGVDMRNTAGSRRTVLDYLRRVAPTRARSLGDVFSEIAVAEAGEPSHSYSEVGEQASHEVQLLLRYLSDERAVLVRKASVSEHDEVVEHARLLLQWGRVVAPDQSVRVPLGASIDIYGRSRYLADNVMRLVARDPRAKVIIWAQNAHVAVGCRDAELGLVANMGSTLRLVLGWRYYALGLELGREAYRARRSIPPSALQTLSRAGSLPRKLTTVGLPAFFLDLRSVCAPPSVEAWLSTPQPAYAIPWTRKDAGPLNADVAVLPSYDGIAFIDKTTPTTHAAQYCPPDAT